MASRARQRLPGRQAATLAAPREALYSPCEIVDAPEHHAYAWAMGLLTWGTWDAEPRPFEERLRDFLQAYPVEAPARFQGTMLTTTSTGEYGVAAGRERLVRIQGIDSSFGTLAEALARFGLKRRAGSQYVPREIEVAPFREIARIRNHRLRVLHGSVDIEAGDMDEAKAAEIERFEKKRAAEQIRAARERMRLEGSMHDPRGEERGDGDEVTNT